AGTNPFLAQAQSPASSRADGPLKIAGHKGHPVMKLDRQAASPVQRSTNRRSSMEYRSPFEDWYTYSTVHKPLPNFTCETGLVLFPPELVPGIGHPLVDKLG